MNLTNVIQDALTEQSTAQLAISRAEDDIASAISNKALAIIADRDVVHESDKLGIAVISTDVARAIVDFAAKGFGTSRPVPTHLLAEMLNDPVQREHLVNHGTKSLMRQVETSVLKRVRLRNEKFDYERRNEQPRNIEIGPISTDGGVVTASKGVDVQPTPSRTVPVLEYGHAPRNKDVDLHGNDLTPRGRDYPAKKKRK